MTADLVAFLNARLDEDQARAERMGHYDPDGEGGYYSCPATRAEPIGDLLAGEENCDCGMTAQRARVLADVQAKRAIIALHTGHHECVAWQRHSTVLAPEEVDDRTATVLVSPGYIHENDPTLRFLAAVYADHVDYRPEWAPYV